MFYLNSVFLPDKDTGKSPINEDEIIQILGNFRNFEGNGRTARVLANLMARKQGYNGLDFKHLDFDEYVIAVQQSARRNYSLMEKIIISAF